MQSSDGAFLRRVLIVLGVLVLALLGWTLHHVLLLLFSSIVLSLLLTSISEPLHRRLKIPPAVALAATVLSLVGGLALVGAFFGWSIQVQVSQAADLLPKAFQAFLARANANPVGSRLMGDMKQLHVGTLLPTLFHLPRYALSTVKGVAEVFLATVGGIYLAAQPRLYRDGLLHLLPRRLRGAFAGVFSECGMMLRRWLVAQLIAMVVVGVAIGLGTWIIGAPAPIALGLFAGLAEFVPIAGPVVASVPALLLALSVGPDKAAWTLGLFIVVQQMESNLLMPLIQRQVVSLPPVLTLFALVSIGILFGPLGVLMATPLTVVGVVAVRRLYLDAHDEDGASANPVPTHG